VLFSRVLFTFFFAAPWKRAGLAVIWLAGRFIVVPTELNDAEDD